MEIALQTGALMMAIFVLPETLKKQDQREFNYRDKTQLLVVLNSVKQISVLNRSTIFCRLAATLLFSSETTDQSKRLYSQLDMSDACTRCLQRCAREAYGLSRASI